MRRAVTDLGLAVLDALGPDYQGSSKYEHYFRITHLPSGMGLGCFTVGYNERNTKLEVKVEAPEGPTGSLWLPDDPPSRINLSLQRPAKDLARDIERRLVQVWLPLWPAIVKQQHRLIIEHDTAQTAIHEIARQLDAGRVLDWGHRQHVALGQVGDSMHVRAHVARHGEVDFQISNVPTELAKKIVVMLRDSGF